MARLMLNDELWSKLRVIMIQQGIYDKPNLRLVVEAMLYRMRVGCPWRDLPASFGCWNSIYQQFNRWSSQNKLMHIFKALIQEPDLEWKNYPMQRTLLQTKGMIVKRFERLFEKNHPFP